MTFDFIKIFNEKINMKNISWEVRALASPDGQIFSLGSVEYQVLCFFTKTFFS